MRFSKQFVPCKPGYYRSKETNRCRKIRTSKKSKTCPEGKILVEGGKCVKLFNSPKKCRQGYIRLKSGKCKKLFSPNKSITPIKKIYVKKTCPQGYYRSKETKRCRKLFSPTNPRSMRSKTKKSNNDKKTMAMKLHHKEKIPLKDAWKIVKKET